MIDDAALFRAFEEYARGLLLPYEVGPVLYRLVDQCVDVLDVDGAGVSLAEDGHTLAFVAATDASVAAIEGQQADQHEGPCHHAYQNGQQVAVADLAAERRWPAYCRAAIAHGARAAVGVPMPVGERRIGALNLYRHRPHAWEDDELEVAQLLADMATGYTLNGTELEETRSLGRQLQHALDSRVVVEQAKGVLAERHGVPPVDAVERLRRRARATHTRTHDLAQQVLDGDLDL